MAAKKTTRSPKSAVPAPSSSSDTPAAAPRARTSRAARPTAAHDTSGNGATPKTARRRRSAAASATPVEAIPVATPFETSAVAAAPPRSPLAPEVNDEVLDAEVVPDDRQSRAVSDDEVRVRAYFLSLEHRGQGSPEYFWHLAERELRQRSHSR